MAQIVDASMSNSSQTKNLDIESIDLGSPMYDEVKKSLNNIILPQLIKTSSTDLNSPIMRVTLSRKEDTNTLGRAGSKESVSLGRINRTQILQAKSTDIMVEAPSTEPKRRPRAYSDSKKSMFGSFSKKKDKPKIMQISEITGPTNVKHTAHIDASSSLLHVLPVDYQYIIKKAGYGDAELKDPGTFKFIIDFIIKESARLKETQTAVYDAPVEVSVRPRRNTKKNLYVDPAMIFQEGSAEKSASFEKYQDIRIVSSMPNNTESKSRIKENLTEILVPVSAVSSNTSILQVASAPDGESILSQKNASKLNQASEKASLSENVTLAEDSKENIAIKILANSNILILPSGDNSKLFLDSTDANTLGESLDRSSIPPPPPPGPILDGRYVEEGLSAHAPVTSLNTISRPSFLDQIASGPKLKQVLSYLFRHFLVLL